jgi:hypothetical protein
VRGREKGAPPLRRAEGKHGRTGTPPMHQGRRPQPLPRGVERKPSALGEGAGLEQEYPRHRERLRRREHLRHATVYPEPATTTPSSQCEHRRGHLPLPSPLGFFSVSNRRRWGAPSGDLAWMRAFEPQHCRPATVWRSRAIHAPGPAVAVRGPLVAPAVEPGESCAGNGCAATLPCAAPLTFRRLRRAREARPRML